MQLPCLQGHQQPVVGYSEGEAALLIVLATHILVSCWLLPLAGLKDSSCAWVLKDPALILQLLWHRSQCVGYGVEAHCDWYQQGHS
jgi:hypothetical protein